jgi:hypothetical protein
VQAVVFDYRTNGALCGTHEPTGEPAGTPVARNWSGGTRDDRHLGEASPSDTPSGGGNGTAETLGKRNFCRRGAANR